MSKEAVLTGVKMPEPVAYAHFAENGNIRIWADYRLPKLHGQDAENLITTTQAQAYADERVREALEFAAKVPRAYAESLESVGWGNRLPDELTAIFNASTNMADRIRALFPKQSTPA